MSIFRKLFSWHQVPNETLTGACKSSRFYRAHVCIKIEQSIIILQCIWCSCTGLCSIEAKSGFTEVNESFAIIFNRISFRNKECNLTNQL